MNFLIVTHVLHTKKGNDYFAYAPYVNEMNIWFKHVNKVTILAPLNSFDTDSIHQKYIHQNIHFIPVPQFSFINIKEAFFSLFVIPFVFFKIVSAMISANHIHLRCPGNMGLLGSIAQILFPNKPKSVKYAGNWDPKSLQPFSYKLQKWILSSTFLSHTIKVLVYGNWKNQTKNILPFFTATYKENEIVEIEQKKLDDRIHFIFVGTLSKGKQPLYAIKLIEKLYKENNKVQLSIFGEGEQIKIIVDYIIQNKLTDFISLKGNYSRNEMKEIYQKAHFLILPSKSEGWPKVIAEAMFWSCLPIATPVSCIQNMLDNGNRGILLNQNLEEDCKKIESLITNNHEYQTMIEMAKKWSHNFTLDSFENEIIKILKS